MRRALLGLIAIAAAFAGCGRLVPSDDSTPAPGTNDVDGGLCPANIYIDVNNCGVCGFVCPSGDSCISGVCTAPVPDAGLDCPLLAAGCGPNERCCMYPDRCVDPTTDPLNCGQCGITCAANVPCIDSRCGGCYHGETCVGTQSCCVSGCADVQTDPDNCGACGWECPTGDTCVAGKCVAPCGDAGSCAMNQICCASGCVDSASDATNCGGCGNLCGSTAICLDGSCVASEGAFNPTVNPTYLSPGGHYFTSINVPAGVTVYVAGAGQRSGTLDLHATGAIEIDGTIDLSGGPGAQSTIVSLNPDIGRAGGGGFTGEPYVTPTASEACALVAGISGSLGVSIAASPGTCPVMPLTYCEQTPNDKRRLSPDVTLSDGGHHPAYGVFAAPGASYGGGAGVFTGFRAYGSGGGGPAGGAPGWPGPTFGNEPDCMQVSGGGGAVTGLGGVGGGAPYDGVAGALGQTQCENPTFTGANVAGGGGGSIGTSAATDLAVTTTFQTGSAGGGGSADYANRPFSGGTSGGGGAGGALQLAGTTIIIKGQLLANGGAGADAFLGTPAASTDGCDPEPGAAGGGGSGGVIYLSAPSIAVAASATISAVGGGGGAPSAYATGGGGGAGGLGRIRLSVGAAGCSLDGTFQPPLANACQPSAASGARGMTYVGTYPN